MRGRRRSSVRNALDLTFLEPWRAVLRESVIAMEFGERTAPLSATFRCWPPSEQENASPDIYVQFPGDGEGRADRQKLQRLREAMELFTVVGAVGGDAGVTFLSEFLQPSDLDRYMGGHYSSAVPKWTCRLMKKISTPDPAATQSSVTWGQFFGCPEDPYEYSEDFGAAMDKLQIMGRHKLVDKYDPPDLLWGANGNRLRGTLHEKTTTRAPAFPRELGRLFNTDVPPVVQLISVRGLGPLLKVWMQDDRALTEQSFIGELRTPSPLSLAASFIPPLTVALAQGDPQLVELELDDTDIDPQQRRSAVKNAGFMLSTLVCGRSTCGLPDKPYGIPLLTRRGELDRVHLKIPTCSDMGLAAVWSAVSEASFDGKLKITTQTDKPLTWEATVAHWQWIAYCCSASISVREVDIVCPSLAKRHLAVMKAVLKNRYPQPVLGHEASKAAEPEYGVVELLEGTELQSIIAADVTQKLTQTGRFRALFNPTMNDCVNAVIPGYGICQVNLSDGVRFVADSLSETSSDQAQSPSNIALSLFFTKVTDAQVLLDMLALLGDNVRSLSISQFQGDGNAVSLDLSAFAVACPQVEELRTWGFDTCVSDYKLLLSWGIKRLKIGAGLHVANLEHCLGDPAFRMSRELVELNIDPTLLVPPFTADLSDQHVKALGAHNGRYLPVVKEPLAASSKAAMLSAVGSGDNASSPTSKAKAIQRLDSTCLSRIFGYAATPERRVARVAEVAERPLVPDAAVPSLMAASQTHRMNVMVIDGKAIYF